MSDYDYDDEPRNESDAMKIEVRISEYDMNGIASTVAAKMAEQVLRNKAAEIQRMADELVTAKALEMIDAAIGSVVADALSRPMTPTDIFGRPQGAPCSVAEYIAKGAEAYLTTRIDPNGKPTNDSFWNKKEYSRLDRFVATVLDGKFDAEMKAAVEGIKGEVRAEMRRAASAWLDKFQAASLDKLTKA